MKQKIINIWFDIVEWGYDNKFKAGITIGFMIKVAFDFVV